MLCKWCGMESAKADQCSWCHRPFTATTSEGTEPSTPVVRSGSRPPVSLRRQTLSEPEEEAVDESDDEVGIGSAPKPVAPETPPLLLSHESPQATPRTIIGLKRPGGLNTPPPQSNTRPPLSPPATKAAAQSPTPPARIPAPGIVGMKRPPAPGVPIARPDLGASSNKTQVPANVPVQMNPVPQNRPALPHLRQDLSQSENTTPTVPTRPSAPSNRPSVPASMLEGSTPSSGVSLFPEGEEETGGLAAGISAPKDHSNGVSAAEAHVPQIGSFNAQQSKYYTDQVIDTVSGTHYDANSGRPTNYRKGPEADIVLNWDDAARDPSSSTVTRFLLIYAAILATVGVFSYASKSFFPIPLMCIGLFSAGILMPVMRAVPWQRDDSDDVIWFALFNVVFGPGIGLIMYSILGIIKQGVNPAMVGCFIATLLMHIIVFVALLPSQLIQFQPPILQHGGAFNLTYLLVNAGTGLLTLIGWYCANFFHKLDE